MLARLAVVLPFGALAATAVWGVLLEPRTVDVRRVRASVPRLPAAWEGRRVALFADIQVGICFSNYDTIRRIVQHVLRESPAVVLLAGDYVYQRNRNPDKALRDIADLLRPIPDSGIPTYAVLVQFQAAWSEMAR